MGAVDFQTLANWAWVALMGIGGWIINRLHARVDRLEAGKADKSDVMQSMAEVKRDLRELHDCMDDLGQTMSEQHARILERLIDWQR